MSQTHYAIIGGGINGLSVARQILLDHPHANVVLFEKESRVAAHQTSHNSGVVHAGLYYEPGSLKATLCRRGVELMRDYCLKTNCLTTNVAKWWWPCSLKKKAVWKKSTNALWPTVYKVCAC